MVFAAGCSCVTEQTRPCELTLGVCQGSSSRYVGGQWTACDYGANYERTEQRCDGLDNDCDGRVDVSWKRSLLKPEANPNGELWWGDAAASQIIVRADGGLVVPVLQGLFNVSADLSSVSRVSFPEAGSFEGDLVAYLVPRSDGWLRIAYSYRVDVFGPNISTVTYLIYAHSLRDDGTAFLEPDGGLVSWRGFEREGSFAGMHLLEKDAGWVAATAPYYANGGSPLLLPWVLFGSDGGMETGLVDAGFDSRGVQLLLSPGRRELTLGLMSSATGNVLHRWSPPESEPIAFAQLPWGCLARSTEPLLYQCVAAQGGAVFASDGGMVVGPTVGSFIFQGRPSTRLVAWRSVEDGGATEPLDLSLVTEAGQTALGRLHGPVVTNTLQFEEVRPGLLLFVWADGPVSPPNAYCPACRVEGLSAQYLCVP